MKTHVVIDGNAFYEIDEECVRRKEKEQQLKKQQRGEKNRYSDKKKRDR